MQKRIPYTSFDHVIMETAQALFKKLYSRRMLIRLIGVRLSELVHGTQQLNLFEDTPEQVNLYLAMDKMRKRYGSDAVRRAVGIKT
jgi:DNA polymerase-4